MGGRSTPKARGIEAEPPATVRSTEAGDGADSPTRAGCAPEVRISPRSGSPKVINVLMD
jgi:hypothetical protein